MKEGSYCSEMPWWRLGVLAAADEIGNKELPSGGHNQPGSLVPQTCESDSLGSPPAGRCQDLPYWGEGTQRTGKVIWELWSVSGFCLHLLQMPQDEPSSWVWVKPSASFSCRWVFMCRHSCCSSVKSVHLQNQRNNLGFLGNNHKDRKSVRM